MSGDGSHTPPSVFDNAATREQDTEPTTARDSEEPESYDLKPPPPTVSHDNLELLASRFFSVDHLDIMLRDPNLANRFTRFLEHYRPQYTSTLSHYLEARKAIAAVDYANALAETIPSTDGGERFAAATFDEAFEMKARQIAEDLIDDALPAYLTHRMVALVTDTLVKEIIGNNAPIMKDLVPSLAEVYCISDPSMPDNPIVYASDGMEYSNHRLLLGSVSANSIEQSSST